MRLEINQIFSRVSAILGNSFGENIVYQQSVGRTDALDLKESIDRFSYPSSTIVLNREKHCGGAGQCPRSRAIFKLNKSKTSPRFYTGGS